MKIRASPVKERKCIKCDKEKQRSQVNNINAKILMESIAFSVLSFLSENIIIMNVE